MTDEAIKSACSRAEELISSVKSPDLRRDAFRVVLQTILAGSGQVPASTKIEQGVRVQPSQGKSKARPDGLKSRISNLVDSGFFVAPRSLHEVGEELKVLGWIHKNKEISMRLLDFVRAHILRRKEGQRDSKKAMLYSKW